MLIDLSSLIFKLFLGFKRFEFAIHSKFILLKKKFGDKQDNGKTGVASRRHYWCNGQLMPKKIAAPLAQRDNLRLIKLFVCI